LGWHPVIRFFLLDEKVANLGAIAVGDDDFMAIFNHHEDMVACDADVFQLFPRSSALMSLLDGIAPQGDDNAFTGLRWPDRHFPFTLFLQDNVSCESRLHSVEQERGRSSRTPLCTILWTPYDFISIKPRRGISVGPALKPSFQFLLPTTVISQPFASAYDGYIYFTFDEFPHQ
jgi:hypothetical protein